MKIARWSCFPIEDYFTKSEYFIWSCLNVFSWKLFRTLALTPFMYFHEFHLSLCPWTIQGDNRMCKGPVSRCFLCPLYFWFPSACVYPFGEACHLTTAVYTSAMAPCWWVVRTMHHGTFVLQLVWTHNRGGTARTLPDSFEPLFTTVFVVLLWVVRVHWEIFRAKFLTAFWVSIFFELGFCFDFLPRLPVWPPLGARRVCLVQVVECELCSRTWKGKRLLNWGTPMPMLCSPAPPKLW